MVSGKLCEKNVGWLPLMSTYRMRKREKERDKENKEGEQGNEMRQGLRAVHLSHTHFFSL